MDGDKNDHIWLWGETELNLGKADGEKQQFLMGKWESHTGIRKMHAQKRPKKTLRFSLSWIPCIDTVNQSVKDCSGIASVYRD